MKPFLDSTRAVHDGCELFARVRKHGYVFIRGLLPPETLEGLRRQCLAIARDGGWVKAGTPLADGIADMSGFSVEPEPDFMRVYGGMYKLPEFHALQHHPNLVGLFERMLGKPLLPHPHLIGRTVFPGREEFTTPAHQDFIGIQGTAETYTAWIPLSDVPSEMGGLQVAAASHTCGVYDYRPTLGTGGQEVTDPLTGAWRSNPFEQGDVLIFHSMAVHKGVPNRSDRLRLSMDARYQKASDPIAPISLLPHLSEPFTKWDEVYADWPDEFGLKYYWRKRNLTVQDYDNSYHEKRDRMAFEMGKNGDRRSVSTLQRIAARDADPAKREKAENLLAVLDDEQAESPS